MNEEGVVPTGLDLISIAGDPTLKRGANKFCAYGAGAKSAVSTRSFTEYWEDNRGFCFDWRIADGT